MFLKFILAVLKLGIVLLPKGHWEISGDIFGSYSWRVILVVHAGQSLHAAEHPESIWLKMSVVLRLRNPHLE